MIEFFAINVDRFVGPGQKQLQVFGDAIDKKMQTAWTAPAVKSVAMLERIQHLITPMIRSHFDDIVAGGRGYRGYYRTMANTIGFGKWMCRAQQVGAAKEDFLFVAGEEYFKATAWRCDRIVRRLQPLLKPALAGCGGHTASALRACAEPTDRTPPQTRPPAHHRRSARHA